MSDHTVTLKNWYPHQFTVDPNDELGELQLIPLRITRFTVEQGRQFTAHRATIQDPPSARAIYRKSEGDEQAKTLLVTSAGAQKREVEVFVVSDDEVRRRRLQEMNESERQQVEDQERRDLEAEYAFLVDTVRQYIRVAPTAHVRFELEDGQIVDLQTGDDLVRAFGGHRPLLTRLAAAVWAENTLTPQEKKRWRLLSASTRSSTTPPTAAPGARPDGTAAPAAPEASAASEGVTGFRGPTPSGSTVM